jgi:hypothetical protein
MIIAPAFLGQEEEEIQEMLCRDFGDPMSAFILQLQSNISSQVNIGKAQA